MRASSMSPELASRLVRIALDNVVREYPNKLDHVINGPADLAAPRVLHPAFYGSYDWHSCVHMHWLLARLLRRGSGLREAGEIIDRLDAHLSPVAIAAEVAYLCRAGAQSFERTYGWAWLLKLAEELGRGAGADFERWTRHLGPLAEAFVARYLEWLAKAALPLRTGTHANSAFGLAFALDYARAVGELALSDACEARALDWYGNDRDYPAAWEPSGADFLSPALVEADLMGRVLPPAAFADWLARLLPALADGAPATLFTPVAPTDRGDPQLVHLDGLNLSRAWSFRGIAAALPANDVRVPLILAAADRHLQAGLAGIASSDYMGSHWLASFVALALTGA